MSVGHIIIAIAIVLVMGVVAIDVINNIMGYMIKKKGRRAGNRQVVS